MIYFVLYILTNNNRWQSPEKATRDESRAQICAGDWWRQEAAQIPPGDRRVERNPQVPKVHGIAHPKVAVSTLGERNRARFQDWLKIPIERGFGVTRSVRSVLGWLVRRHQLVRDPRQESYDHAEGCSIGETHQRRTRLRSLSSFASSGYNSKQSKQIIGSSYFLRLRFVKIKQRKRRDFRK